MEKQGGFYGFLDGLEDNFRHFIQFFRTFNFGNIGTYVGFLFLSGIATLILILIWSYVLAFVKGNNFDLSNVESIQQYVDFIRYSRLVEGMSILSIGLLGMMISPYNTKKPVTFSMLTSGMGAEGWRNFGICVGIYLAFSFLVPERFLFTNFFFYDYEWSPFFAEISGPDSIKYWLNNVIKIVFILLPYYLAALCVQMGDSRFSLLPSGRGPSVFAGLALLLAVTFSFEAITNFITFYALGIVSIATENENVLTIVNGLILLFIASILIGGKARALGINQEVTTPDASEVMAETDILDDL